MTTPARSNVRAPRGILAPALIAALLTVSTATTQTLPEGYDSTAAALPAGAANVLTLGAGTPGAGGLVYFDGTTLQLAAGGQTRALLTLPMPVFGSFTIAAGPGLVLFGESSNGNLWAVPLNGAPPTQPLATLAFNYDAVRWDSNRVIVSAKTGGFGANDNDLWAVDVNTGSTQLLAQIPGASGPLAVDRNAALCYATSSPLFPTPPGATDVLRFDRTVVDLALLTQQVLTPANATVVIAGLDSAGDLAFDGDDDLLFVDWFNDAVSEIDDTTGPARAVKVLIDYSGTPTSAAELQVARTAGAGFGAGVFEPFQAAGTRLLVRETDYASTNDRRTVRPAAPTLTASVASPIPAGAFTLDLADGPQNGAALIALGLPQGPGFTSVAVPGFEQPLLWRTGLLIPVNTHFVALDAAGAGSLPLTNPGFTPALTIRAQAAMVDQAGGVIAASAPAAVVLQQ